MKFLRDPLVVFLIIGAGIFALFSRLAPEEPSAADPYRIDITDDTLAVLEDEWVARWKRPPTEQEFKSLIDSYVKEEILFREATKLGLDRSDSIIRRRLAQKMEFLTSDIADLREVSEENLAIFYKEHADRYRVAPEVGFRHLYFSSDKRKEATAKDAETLLASLKTGSLTFDQAMEQSDRTLLSSEFATTSLPIIGRQFGESFASGIAEAKPGQWFGPVESSYGLHLVDILERKAGALPPLDSIREKVYSDYRYEKRTQLNEDMVEELLKRYDVVIGDPADEEEPS